MKTPRADWTPARIREAIHAKGISMEQLSLQGGASSSIVRQALTRRLPSGERIISEFLGVPVHEIWPSRYHPDGRSRSRPLAVKATGADRAAHRQNAGSA